MHSPAPAQPAPLGSTGPGAPAPFTRQTTRLPADGVEMAFLGEHLSTEHGRCTRCGLNPATGHDRQSGGTIYCPGFFYSGAGRWISTWDLVRALRSHSRRAISFWTTNRVEEHEGPFGSFHYVAGIGVDDRYATRIDYPRMPEFGIYDQRAGLHRVLYKGWRLALPDLCAAAGIHPRLIRRALRLPDGRTTEEWKRFLCGFV